MSWNLRGILPGGLVLTTNTGPMNECIPAFLVDVKNTKEILGKTTVNDTFNGKHEGNTRLATRKIFQAYPVKLISGYYRKEI